MAIVQVLTMIGIIVVSLLGGFIFFYGLSPLQSEVKRKHLEALASLLVNLVIYIWLAKMVLNLPLLFKDPLAVLSYPSTAQAFYLATLFLAINVGYNIIRGELTLRPLLKTSVPVLLGASFTYEFIQVVVLKEAYTWLTLVGLMVLMIVYVLLHDKVNQLVLVSGLMFAWTGMMLVLAYVLPFVTTFGYLIAPWYLVVLLVCHIGLIIYLRKGSES